MIKSTFLIALLLCGINCSDAYSRANNVKEIKSISNRQIQKQFSTGADSISVITESFFNAVKSNDPEGAISEFNRYTEFDSPETDSVFIDIFNKSGNYIGYYMSGKMYFGDKNSVQYSFSICFKKITCEIHISLRKRGDKWFVNNYYIDYDRNLFQKIVNNDTSEMFSYNYNIGSNNRVKNYSAAEIIWRMKDNPDIVDHKLDIEQSVKCKDKQYFVVRKDNSAGKLYSLDRDNNTNCLLDNDRFRDIEKGAKSELRIATYAEKGIHYSWGVKELANVDNRLYLTYSTGKPSYRLLQYNSDGIIKPVDGITSVQIIKPWGDNLVMEGVSDEGKEGLFLLNAHGNIVNRLEYKINFPALYNIAVIDTMAQVFSENTIYQLYKKDLMRRFNFPDSLNIYHFVDIKNGVLIETRRLKNGRLTQNSVGDYFIQESLTNIIDSRNLPEYMHGINPANIKSINGTAYFYLKSDNGERQVIYYRSAEEYGNITDKFNKYGVRIDDILTEINESLLIRKLIEYDGKTYSILQLYDIKRGVIKNVEVKGVPVGVNVYSDSFIYNGYVYFIGSYGLHKDCLLRYNGVDDPEMIEIK